MKVFFLYIFWNSGNKQDHACLYCRVLREVLCHFLGALMKEWRPCIHDYMSVIFIYLFIYFMAVGCKQINPTLLKLQFSSSQRVLCFANTRSLFVCFWAGREYLVFVEVCLLSELNEKAGWWIYTRGIFKKLLPCHRIAKCSANSFPIMLSVCLVNWPQMPSFYKEKYIFSACNVSGKPRIWSHYLFNLLA